MTSLPRKTMTPNGLTFLEIIVFHYNIQYEKSKDAPAYSTFSVIFLRYPILHTSYCLLR